MSAFLWSVLKPLTPMNANLNSTSEILVLILEMVLMIQVFPHFQAREAQAFDEEKLSTVRPQNSAS